MSSHGETARQVNEILSDVYTPDGLEIWWQARNRMLGGVRPSALLEGSDEDREHLIAVAEYVSGGAW